MLGRRPGYFAGEHYVAAAVSAGPSLDRKAEMSRTANRNNRSKNKFAGRRCPNFVAEELIVGYWSLVIGYPPFQMTNDQRPITNNQF